jgi:hypothetical protein
MTAQDYRDGMSEPSAPSSFGHFMASVLGNIETTPGQGPYTHTVIPPVRHRVSVHKPLELHCTCGWVSDEDWLEIDLEDLLDAAEEHVATHEMVRWIDHQRGRPVQRTAMCQVKSRSTTPLELKVGDIATYRDEAGADHELVVTSIEPGYVPRDDRLPLGDTDMSEYRADRHRQASHGRRRVRQRRDRPLRDRADRHEQHRLRR